MKMKVFTINSGVVYDGATVESFALKGAGITIPAILIGEEGRGRELGILPVQLLPEAHKKWQENGSVRIFAATLGTTKAGKPKLFQAEEADTDEKCICVFRTMIGYRGCNIHTGDRKEVYYTIPWYISDSLPPEVPKKPRYTKEEMQQYAPILCKHRGADDWSEVFDAKIEFLPFPGDVICSGIIAQGAAGNMGSGRHLIAVIPANTVFRTAYGGRLYGAPGAHYYIFRDGNIISATWQERAISDIF